LLQDKLGIFDLRSYYWYSEAANIAQINISDLGNCYWYSKITNTARINCSCWIRDGGYELGDGGGGIKVCEGILIDLFGVNYTSLNSSAFSSRLFSI
jgi:hypothetical protein